MTLSPSTRYFKYLPVVATTQFSVPWPLFSGSDLTVLINGVATIAYTISATYSDGRSTDAKVILSTAVSSGTVEIKGTRAPRVDRAITPATADLIPTIALEIDRMAASVQEQGRDLSDVALGVASAASDIDELQQDVLDLQSLEYYTDISPTVSRESRAAMIAFLATDTFQGLDDGTLLAVEGDLYVKSKLATAIPDFPDLLPFGQVARLSQFGCRGNAVISSAGTLTSGTDDTAAFASALAWMKALRGRKLLGNPASTYLISSTLSGTGDFNVDLNGAKIFNISNSVSIDWKADAFGPYKLAANYVTDALTISVTGSPLPQAPTRGTIMKIVSDGVDPADRDSGSGTSQFRTGEFFIVGTGSTTTSIVLAAPLQFIKSISPTRVVGDEAVVASYTTALNARVVYADNDQQFTLKNVSSRFLEGQSATWTSGNIACSNFIRPLIENVYVGRGYGPGIKVGGTYGATIRNCGSKNLENNTSNGQYGYGVADAGAFTAVENFSSDDVRHSYTSGVPTDAANSVNVNRSLQVGRTVGAQIIGGHCTGGIEGHWDTHHSSEAVTFSSTYSEGGKGFSASLRGRAISLLGHKSRNQKNGVMWFTEYASGDTDDDFWTAGKTLDDFTSGIGSDLDVQCNEYPVQVKHATVKIGGSNLYKSRGQTSVYIDGGALILAGHHEFSSVSGAVSYSNAGVIHMTNPNGLTPFSSSTLVIDGTVIIDARDAAYSGTMFAFNLASNCSVIVKGRLKIRLPAGAGYKTGLGSVTCEGNGVIEFDVAGASGSSIIADTGVLAGQRVRSLDAAVIWDDVAYGPARMTYQNSNLAILHSGTGVEVQNVYRPIGQYAFYALNLRGRGWFRCLLTGRKNGTAGAASIEVRSGNSNYVASLPIPTAADIWQIEVVCSISAVNTQLYVGKIVAQDDAVPTVTTRIVRKPETLVPDNHGNPAFSFGIIAAVGDTVTIESAEVWATSGGYII